MKNNRILSLIAWMIFTLFCIMSLVTLNYVFLIIGVVLRFIFLIAEIWDDTGSPSPRQKKPKDAELDEKHWIYYNLYLNDDDKKDDHPM